MIQRKSICARWAFHIERECVCIPKTAKGTSSSGQQLAESGIVNTDYILDRNFDLQSTLIRNSFRGALASGEGKNTNRWERGVAYMLMVEFLPFGRSSKGSEYSKVAQTGRVRPKIPSTLAPRWNEYATVSKWTQMSSATHSFQREEANLLLLNL